MPSPAGQLTTAELAAIAAALQAQATLRQRLVGAAVTAAVTPFTSLTDWWSNDAVAQAIAAALRVLQPIQTQAARVTDAYLARVLTTMTGRTVRPVGAVDVTRLRRAIEALPPDAGGARPTERDKDAPARTEADDDLPAVLLPQRPDGGQLAKADTVDPGEPYRRAAALFRKAQVMDGASPEKALSKAINRVAVVADTDVMLAMREQVRTTLSRNQDIGVIGYRRVPRFEPSEKGYGPCGLCIVASDRIYSVKELKHIHQRCRCEVLPIIGDIDPGLTLNGDDLRELYGAAGGTAGRKLKRITVAFVEHGELGPVLTDGGRHFRGPRQVAAATTNDRPTRARIQLESLEATLDDLYARDAGGEDVSSQIDWHTAKINELRRELMALL